MTRIDMDSRELPRRLAVLAHADWCARAAVLFLQTALPEANAAIATAPADLDDLVRARKADIVLVAVPNRQPVHAALIREVRARWPDQRLAVVTSEHFPDVARAARAAEAHAYITTGCDPKVVHHALVHVHRNGRYFVDESPEVHAPAGEPAHAPGDMDARVAKLTPRERQVMDLLGRGHANREIASALDLREGTVRIYVHRVIRRLGLRNRVDVALCARRLNGHAG